MRHREATFRKGHPLKALLSLSDQIEINLLLSSSNSLALALSLLLILPSEGFLNCIPLPLHLRNVFYTLSELQRRIHVNAFIGQRKLLIDCQLVSALFCRPFASNLARIGEETVERVVKGRNFDFPSERSSERSSSRYGLRWNQQNHFGVIFHAKRCATFPNVDTLEFVFTLHSWLFTHGLVNSQI